MIELFNHHQVFWALLYRDLNTYGLKRPFLWPESIEARQRSYDLGIHLGSQRRNKDVIAWVKKRRRTIRREDLISFLCGKVPPPRTPRAPPRVAVVSASRPPPPETDSSVETDLQPFREAIALHGEQTDGWSSRPGRFLPPLHSSSLASPSRPERCHGEHFSTLGRPQLADPPRAAPESPQEWSARRGPQHLHRRGDGPPFGFHGQS